MQESLGNLDFEHLHQIFTLLGRSTDDYLYIYDLEQDQYTISETAIEQFALESTQFFHATEVLKGVCHPDDWPMLEENIQGIKDRTLPEHNIEYRWMGKKGYPIWISCRGQVILNNEGQVRYLVGRIAELGRKNTIDNVTGLYREVKLRSDLLNLKAIEKMNGFLLQIGIDNFREINDKYGKTFGNEVLSSVADCIRICVGDSGTIYRMDGDEMVVVVEQVHDGQEDPANVLYHEIRNRVDAAISESDYQHFYTISGGSAYFGKGIKNVFTLMEKAEFALHQAKQKGRNTYVTYDEKEYEIFVKRLDMQEKLRLSVRDNFNGFELYYQPIVNIKKRKILGAEALLAVEEPRVWHGIPSRIYSASGGERLDYSSRPLDYPHRNEPVSEVEREGQGVPHQY